MVDQSTNSKYFLDGVFLREFKTPPYGVDMQNLLPEQREFMVLIAAVAPSLEGYRRLILSRKERAEIDKVDYVQIVKKEHEPDYFRVGANARKISVSQYIEQLAKQRKEEDLQDFYKEYPEFRPDDVPEPEPEKMTLGSGVNEEERSRMLKRVRDELAAQEKATKMLYDSPFPPKTVESNG